MYRFRAVGLQRLDDPLAGKQGVGLVLDFLDLVDFLVQAGDFALEKLVRIVLLRNLPIDQRKTEEPDQCSKHRHQSQQDIELLSPRLALLLAMRK